MSSSKNYLPIPDEHNPFSTAHKDLGQRIRFAYESTFLRHTPWHKEVISGAAKFQLEFQVLIGLTAAGISTLDRRVLEVGCGLAVPSFCAAYYGMEALAIDAKHKAIATAYALYNKFGVSGRLGVQCIGLDEFVSKGEIGIYTTVIADEPTNTNGFEAELFATVVRHGLTLIYSPPKGEWIMLPHEEAIKEGERDAALRMAHYREILETEGFLVTSLTLGKDILPRGLLIASKNAS